MSQRVWTIFRPLTHCWTAIQEDCVTPRTYEYPFFSALTSTENNFNRKLPGVPAGFRKGRWNRGQIANIHWIIGKARVFQKNIYFCFIDYTKALDCVDHSKLWKILKDMGIPDHLTCLLRKPYAVQEGTEMDMEQKTGSKLGKEYNEAVYCHSAYFICMQSTCKILGWMKHKLESRLLGEIPITAYR